MFRLIFVLMLFSLNALARAGDLPDSALTPGFIDASVTQANIQQTICVKGYTKTIRPTAKYTDALKKVQLVQYGFADKNPKHYEEDHLISLELGGHPRDPRNLWPQHRLGACNASDKDKLENKLHQLVCSKVVKLSDAQAAISKDWIKSYAAHIEPAGCAVPKKPH